jgi:hypothetical protein
VGEAKSGERARASPVGGDSAYEPVRCLTEVGGKHVQRLGKSMCKGMCTGKGLGKGVGTVCAKGWWGYRQVTHRTS